MRTVQADNASNPASDMTAALLFDLYETLLTERGRTLTRASSLGGRLGVDEAAFREAWKSRRPRVIRGDVSFETALLDTCAQLGHVVGLASVHTVAEERVREKSALFEHFDPDVSAAIRELHERGLNLAVVSNCFAEDVHAWPSCPLAQWFDASVFSFAVGSAKPEPEIYLETIRRLRVAPIDTVFVGDGGDDELLGAERAGLRAAQATWFRGDTSGLPARIPRLPSWRALFDFVVNGSRDAPLPDHGPLS